MLVNNLTSQDYWFGPLHLEPNATGYVVDDTSATSLYLTDDGVADAINTLLAANKISVSGAALPFPRPTGQPQILHGDGSPEGLVYAGQGSMFMVRTAASATNFLYTKTSGVHVNTGWAAINPGTSPGYGTTLPGTPTDALEYILTDSVTNPTYQWRLRYNAGSSRTDKWEFIGGPEWAATPAVQTRLIASYNATVSLTVPRSGVYNVTAFTTAVNSALGRESYVENGSAIITPDNSGSSGGTISPLTYKAQRTLTAGWVISVGFAGDGSNSGKQYANLAIEPVRLS